MMMQFQPAQELAKSLPDQSLFAAWLGQGLPGDLAISGRECSASAELERCLGDSPQGSGNEPAPFFAATATDGAGSTWVASLLADQPGSRGRQICLDTLQQVQTGNAEVVVTGQQPGALGGPLYTLFKISATVALARLRTRNGRPTVPVFWSGDDDDDLAEALAPRGYDPLSDELFGNPGSLVSPIAGQRRRPCVGSLSASRWSTRESQWLNDDRLRARLPMLGLDLADMWAAACAEEWSWARLNRRFLLRVFRGSGLIIVSGNDPFLHSCAQPLYQDILSRRRELAQLAADRGAALAGHGFPEPINGRSRYRHLFVSEGTGRAFLEPDEAVPDLSRLRPGVLLRSPVQDWLLQPAAVVVGPGELAYLRQLDPLYAALGVNRGPLTPRLFGWLVPTGFPVSRLTGDSPAYGGLAEPPEILAARAARVAEEEVRRILEVNIGADPERAARLAAGRGRRWSRSVAALFQAEAQRQARGGRPGQPVWVFPEGKRQERVLASLTAAALWGDDLVAAMCQAGEDHFTAGLSGKWLEFAAQVADPTGDRP
jgi:hypothetical protein